MTKKTEETEGTFLARIEEEENVARAELEAKYRSKDEEPANSELTRRDVVHPSRQILRQMQRRIAKRSASENKLKPAYGFKKF